MGSKMKKYCLIILFILNQATPSDKKQILDQIQKKEIALFELTQQKQINYNFLAIKKLALEREEAEEIKITQKIDSINSEIFILHGQEEGVQKEVKFFKKRIEQESQRKITKEITNSSNTLISSLRKSLVFKLETILKIKQEIRSRKIKLQELYKELEKQSKIYRDKKIEVYDASQFLIPIKKLFNELEELRKKLKHR